MLYYKCKEKREAHEGTSLYSMYLCFIGYLWYNVGKLFISNNREEEQNSDTIFHTTTGGQSTRAETRLQRRGKGVRYE